LLAVLAAGCTSSPELGHHARRIIGGTETTGYPSVMLVLAQEPGSQLASICTGTLVAPHVVLTAAHCLDPALVGAAAEVSVFAGANIDSASRNDFLATSATHFHPDFDPKKVTDGGDIGVAVLAAARAGETTPLNRVALTDALIGQPATLVGYGKNDGDDANGMSAGKKREVQTVMGSYSERIVRFGEPGKTSCEGDSGGPGLMSIDGATAVVGVVSFGNQACDQVAFDTRVDAYADWIDGYIDEADPGFLEANGVVRQPEGGCAMTGKNSARSGWLQLGALVSALLVARRRRAPPFPAR